MGFTIIREKAIHWPKDLNLPGLLVIICFMATVGNHGLPALTSEHHGKNISGLLRPSFFVLSIAYRLI
jgi:hypothetical protein